MDAAADTPALTLTPRRKAVLDAMLRVDHAGELGARRIYAGQLAVLGRHPVAGPLLREMAAQEAVHLAAFDDLLPRRRVRPTVLTPVWSVAGYALGVGTALLGVRGAMACTVAVETVIAGHYNDQVRTLLGEGYEAEAPLRATLRQFRDEEMEHKETGLANEAEQAFAYRGLSKVIEGGCRAAIFLSERV